MKNRLFLLAFIATLSAHAQNVKNGGWNEQIEVGAYVSLNTTWLFNSAVSSLDEGVSDLDFTFGWSITGSGAYRFNELIAVGLALDYFNGGQKYTGVIGAASTPYESKVSLNGLNVPIYAKIMTRGGAFVEIGWQFGFITGARYSRSGTVVGSNVEGVDVSSSFSSVLYSPHFAFGVDFPLNDEVIITAGIRANYAINNVGGVDGLGNDIADYPNTNPGTPISPNDTPPSNTSMLSAGIFLGARYLFDAGGRY
jgi:hypothetical protein